ncbi:MAG: signal peptide peptidase SppA [Pseudomonadota bacterium]
MRHKGLVIAIIFVLLIAGAFLFGMVLFMAGGSGGVSSVMPFGGGVGIITVDGAIVSADDTVDEIDRFRKNDSVRSVVLRIESPGGSVAASQEILEAVRRLAGKKPVVASMGSVAASGGYYIACGAKKILANPGTITGSIGVRMEHVMIGDLLQWAKIKHETLKSGRLKDLASMDRLMTAEERQVLQGMLDDIHGQFKEEVAKARSLELKKVDEIADGRIYTGRQALELGLVDAMGGLSEAVKMAAEMGGIKGEPRLIRPKARHLLIERLFDTAEKAISALSSAKSLDYWQPLMFMNTNESY